MRTSITFHDQPVGVVWVQTDEPVPYLVRFMIDADWQGDGIGRQAVALVLDELRAMGLETVELSYVPVEDGPERFWLACGLSADRADARRRDAPAHGPPLASRPCARA